MNFLNRPVITSNKNVNNESKTNDYNRFDLKYKPDNYEPYIINGVDINALESVSQYDENEIMSQLEEIESSYTIKSKLRNKISDTNLVDFQKDVLTYDSIDQKIKELNVQLEPLQKQKKLLNSQKKALEQNISCFMSKNNIEICNLPKQKPIVNKNNVTYEKTEERSEEKGALKFMMSKRIMPITQPYIKNKLINFFKFDVNKLPDGRKFYELDSYEKAIYIFEYIYKSREHVEKPVIKQVKYVDVEIDEEINVITENE